EGNRPRVQARRPGAILDDAARAGRDGPRTPRPLPEEVSLPRELGGAVPRPRRPARGLGVPRLRRSSNRPGPPHSVSSGRASRLPPTGRSRPSSPKTPMTGALHGSQLEDPADAFAGILRYMFPWNRRHAGRSPPGRTDPFGLLRSTSSRNSSSFARTVAGKAAEIASTSGPSDDPPDALRVLSGINTTISGPAIDLGNAAGCISSCDRERGAARA